jgi:hypothetical protein
MRTTITLDPETEALVKRAMKERNLSFKQVVNDAIRNGLMPQQRPTIDLPTHNYGPALINLDKATQLAGELENEEILRKMSMGK